MKLTIRQVFFIVLVLGLFLMTLRPISDPDFWWHLRTGQLIVQTNTIPHTDPFSYTRVGAPWITHEWLSEILIYALFRLGGYGLLIFTFSLFITAAFLLTYLRCPAGTRPYVAGFALLLGAVATAPTWGVRPQMISLFLTSLFLFLLDRYRRAGKAKFLIVLPLIMLVWVNLHAGYFLGLALIGIYILAGLMDMLVAGFLKLDQVDTVPTIRSIVNLCIALGGCILVTLINPNGILIIIYPFQTLTSSSMQQFIQEWFSPDFHQLIWQPLAWLILALIGFGMISKKSISTTNILLTLIFGYAALISMRNIPFFALAAIPVLAEQVGSLAKISTAAYTPSRLFKLMVPILLGAILLITCLRFFQSVQEQPKTEAENFPKTAVAWLLENKPAGHLFNSYNWGGYLIWRMYPQSRVYIDGRADVYGDAFIFDYISIYDAKPGWEEKLDKQAVQTVLVESDAPLANELRQSPAWHIAFTDKLSTIFVK
jgi:hypothetical protein